jgi:hypothetical protein
MKYDQRSRLTKMNGSGRFDRVLDMQAMQKSLGALQRDGIPVCIYVGGPEQMPRTRGETVGHWLQRMLVEIEPIRAINPPITLAFDSTSGEPPLGSGVDYQRAFITAVRASHRGPILVEPGFVNDWMGPMGLGTVSSERFFKANILTGRLHWYARRNRELNLNWRWNKANEVRGPVMVFHQAAPSAKPFDQVTKQDDPARVRVIVNWVENVFRQGYAPVVKAPHLPDYRASFMNQ